MWLFLNLILLGIPYLFVAVKDHRALPRVRNSLADSRKIASQQAEQVVQLTRGKSALRADRDDVRRRLGDKDNEAQQAKNKSSRIADPRTTPE